MRKTFVSLFGIVAIFILSGWGAQNSNVSGDKKHAINFYGTLETWSSPDTIINIENISIDNLYKQIPMLLKPTLKPAAKGKKSFADAAQKAAKAAKKAAKAAQKAAKTAKKDGESAAQDAALAAKAAADAAQAAVQALSTTKQAEKTADPKKHILTSDPKTNLIETKIDLVEVHEITVPHPDELWIYQKEKGYRKVEYIEIEIVSKGTKKTSMSYLIEKRKKIYCDRVTASGPEEQEVPLKAIKSLKIMGFNDRDVEKSKNKQEIEKCRMRILKEKLKKNC